mmetsp:Transcript_22621/g.74582  ORF Transcript_22621/g.74582 Transcript_22621/m.74582 type:complete len:266 (+) Transcript_22621:124-921(+)
MRGATLQLYTPPPRRSAHAAAARQGLPIRARGGAHHDKRAVGRRPLGARRRDGAGRRAARLVGRLSCGVDLRLGRERERLDALLLVPAPRSPLPARGELDGAARGQGRAQPGGGTAGLNAGFFTLAVLTHDKPNLRVPAYLRAPEAQPALPPPSPPPPPSRDPPQPHRGLGEEQRRARLQAAAESAPPASIGRAQPRAQASTERWAAAAAAAAAAASSEETTGTGAGRSHNRMAGEGEAESGGDTSAGQPQREAGGLAPAAVAFG